MDYILPRKDCCPLNYMMSILSGMKLGLKRVKDNDAI